MASRFLIIFFFMFMSFSPLIISGTGDFSGRLDRKLLAMKRKEKLTYFKLYWHDIVSGKNPSSVPVVNSTEKSLPFFGRIQMIDNPLTLGTELTSKWVGKAQGFYVWASQTEIGLLQAQNLVFTEGKYNGSSITILGRDLFLNKVREMPVVGGSGIFRLARGYVEARAYQVSLITGDAIVEYNVYVLHY